MRNLSPVHHSWKMMKTRCNNPKDKDYHRYGGRGITVCDAWSKEKDFYLWADANGFEPGLTIERKNNNGNYEPSNCIWATHKEQTRNRHNSLSFTEDEWSDALEMYSTTKMNQTEMASLMGIAQTTFSTIKLEHYYVHDSIVYVDDQRRRNK